MTGMPAAATRPTRMRRVLLILIVAAGLSPGTWWRSPPQAADNRHVLHVASLAQPVQAVGRMQLLGAWELCSPNEHFHGYSALAVLDDATLFAVSDRGRMLRFPPPGAEGPVTLGRFSATPPGDSKPGPGPRT